MIVREILDNPFMPFNFERDYEETRTWLQVNRKPLDSVALQRRNREYLDSKQKLQNAKIIVCRK